MPELLVSTRTHVPTRSPNEGILLLRNSVTYIEPPTSRSDADRGYTGILCGTCAPSYFRHTLTGACESCDSQRIPPWLAWVVVILAVAILSYPSWRCYKWAKEKGYLRGKEEGDKALVDNATTVFFVSSRDKTTNIQSSHHSLTHKHTTIPP